MKKIAFLFVVTTLISCNCNKKDKIDKNVPENETTVVTPSEKEAEEELLIGKISCKNLEMPPYNDWFVENFNNHTLDTLTISNLKPLLKNTRIKVFMGTWCSDSQREVPALHKVLEAADFDEDNLEIIAVNRDKITPNGLEKGKDIQYVPTIIFYKAGKEINRIVESPVASLEKDMLAIISGQEYKHTYAE